MKLKTSIRDVLRRLSPYQRRVRFSEASRNMILEAQQRAISNRDTNVDEDYFLFGLLQQNSVINLLEHLDVSISSFGFRLQNHLNTKARFGQAVDTNTARLTNTTRKILWYSREEAFSLHKAFYAIEPEHIFLGLLRFLEENAISQHLLYEYGVTLAKARSEAEKLQKIPPIPQIPEP